MCRDTTMDATINEADKLEWENMVGSQGYLQSDFNGDGQVNNIDKNQYWLLMKETVVQSQNNKIIL
ncbi:MAG: hypothetical protein R2764_17360 [Bacteroidales bacterium]